MPSPATVTFCTALVPLALASFGTKLTPSLVDVARSEVSMMTYQTVLPPEVPLWIGNRNSVTSVVPFSHAEVLKRKWPAPGTLAFAGLQTNAGVPASEVSEAFLDDDDEERLVAVVADEVAAHAGRGDEHHGAHAHQGAAAGATGGSARRRLPGWGRVAAAGGRAHRAAPYGADPPGADPYGAGAAPAGADAGEAACWALKASYRGSVSMRRVAWTSSSPPP